MKSLTYCLCFCSALFCSSAAGQGKVGLSPQNGVKIRCDGNIGQYPITPIYELLEALHQHPTRTLFRVSWYESAGSWNSSGTALYDKRNKRVKFFCVGGENAAGNPAIAIHEHYLFTSVTPDIFERIVQKDSTFSKNYARVRFDPFFAGNPYDAYFPELAEFGCAHWVFRDSWQHLTGK